MNDRESKFLNRIERANCAIEQSADEIEQSETQNSLTKDDLGKFQQELRRGLQDVAQSCLYSSKTGSQLGSETEHELLRYELGKALARSPEFRKQYITQELARQRRLEN
jgi:hypothetical protein